MAMGGPWNISLVKFIKFLHSTMYFPYIVHDTFLIMMPARTGLNSDEQGPAEGGEGPAEGRQGPAEGGEGPAEGGEGPAEGGEGPAEGREGPVGGREGPEEL